MDPITVLSLISCAESVGRLLFQNGESLYKLIEQAREVDQKIRGLHRETKGLGQTVIAIKDALEQPAIKDHRTITLDYALVWATLDNSIQDCEEMARAMKKKFETAQSAKTSFLSQAWRQYKLGLKEAEIRDLRSQIHTHGSRLQQSLQMISVVASITSPERVIESISPRLDHLISLVQSQPATQVSNMRDPIDNQLSQQRLQQLQNAAQVVISSASAIIGESRSTINGGSMYDTTTGSQFGTPLNAGQNERIDGWIAPPVINEEEISSHSSSSVFGTSYIPIPAPTSSTASISKEGPSLHSGSSSTLRKLDKETIRRLLDEGKKLLSSGNFAEATRLFEQLQKKMKTIPKKQFEDGKCRLLLAISLLEIGLWTPEHGFMSSIVGVNNLEPRPPKGLSLLGRCELLLRESLILLRGFDASYYRRMATYAQCCVFWQMESRDRAYDLCRSTVSTLRVNKFLVWLQEEELNARGPFLGLLSKMCKLRGDEGEAAIYEDMRMELKGAPRPSPQTLDKRYAKKSMAKNQFSDANEHSPHTSSDIRYAYQ